VRFVAAPLESTDAGDLQDLGAATKAAVDRFWFVSAQGVELPDASAAAVDGSVPTEAFGPLLFEDGVLVGASADDEITPPQAEAMLQILIGELHSRKVRARVSCPPSDLNEWGLTPWGGGDESGSDGASKGSEDSGSRWFIQRTVWSVTPAGISHDDVEWLLPNGTWGQMKAGAVSFDDTPSSRSAARDLVVRLRQEASDAGADPQFGEVTAVLITTE
jgi:hypothetical protein